MDQRRTLLDEAGLLSSLSADTLKPKKKTFTFRAAERTLSDVPALLAEVDAELASMTSKLRRVDRAFFRYFYARSGDVPERRTELWERYEFLLGMQQIVVALNQTERALQPGIRALQSGKELTQGDVQSIRGTFGRTRAQLARSVKECAELPLPKLLHLEDAATARDFVLPERLVAEPGEVLTAYWINDLLRQFGQTLSRARKLHFKNLGALLALQEALDPELFATETPRTESD